MSLKNAMNLFILLCLSFCVVLAEERDATPRTLQSFGVQAKHGQPVYPLPANVALGLFNPDPLLDLAYYADGKVQVWQNLGNGTFGNAPLFEQRVGDDVVRMQWHNKGTDQIFFKEESWGNLTLTFASGTSETISHEWMNRAFRGFASQPQIAPGPSSLNFREVWRSPSSPSVINPIQVGDVDNDGMIEVFCPFYPAVGDTSSSRLVAYESFGDNQYRVDWDSLVEHAAPWAITDVDNDGHKEIVIGYDSHSPNDRPVLALLECYGQQQYRFYKTNIGIERPVFKVLETDINHNGIKELTVLTSNSSLDYDRTFVYIAEFVSKGPAGGGGWIMVFDQQIARCDWYVFDMAIGQVDKAGWDEVVLGDGQWLSGPPEYINYLKHDGVPPYPFAWRPHFLDVGLPATCVEPKFLNLDTDTVIELLIGGFGPIGYGSLYGLKHVSDSSWRTTWIDSSLRGGASNISSGLVSGTPTITAHGNRTHGPHLSYSKLEIFQDQGVNIYRKVSEIDLLPDSSAYLGIVMNDVDQDGKMNILGCRGSWAQLDRWFVDLEQDTTLSVMGTLKPTIDFQLNQNYPNPFNPSTAITFTLPEKSNVQISVYNTLGQLVRTLMNEQLSSGGYERIWDGKNDAGIDVGSGVYFCRLLTSTRALTRKMLLTR